MRLTKKDAILSEFSKLWESLFTTPVHLDSALSKTAAARKTVLAQIVPRILLRPVSFGELLGVGMAPGEPWTLNRESLAGWRSARSMAERLYGGLTGERTELLEGSAKPREEDFPPWFIEEVRRDWGDEILKRLVAVLGREAPLCLRVKRNINRESFLRELKARRDLPVRAELSTISPWGIRLGGYAPVLKDEAYARGDFEIQDEGSQLMSLFTLWPEIFKRCLSSAPGETGAGAPEVPSSTAQLTIVDACAGAGGKTLALAEAVGGRGRVYAYDVSESKLSALRRRVSKAGMRNTQAVVVPKDSEEQVISKFAGTADIVLVDAPCTGWGVLRRNPDIKWRQTAEARDRMPALQLRLLKLYSSLVKPGGRLVYGLCTFRKAETLGVVQEFLATEPGFERGDGGFLGPGPCDGFFMQSFTKKKEA